MVEVVYSHFCISLPEDSVLLFKTHSIVLGVENGFLSTFENLFLLVLPRHLSVGQLVGVAFGPFELGREVQTVFVAPGRLKVAR